MAYDAATRSTVLFDGNAMATWAWDGAEWTEEQSPRAPDNRADFAIAGSVRHVVLFGGDACIDVCHYFQDTWSWNGRSWIQRRPSTNPRARADMAMAENLLSKRTVMFGGFNENTDPSLFGDTWVWDGTGWSRKFPATAPPAREEARLAYMPSNDVLVLFGGVGADGYLSDTWLWGGSTWLCVDGCA
jgi:hypothetical protein